MGPEVRTLKCPYCSQNSKISSRPAKISFARNECSFCGSEFLIVNNAPMRLAARYEGTSELNEIAIRLSRRAQQMLDAGQSSEKVLTMLVTAAQGIAGERSVCSILVLDKDGRLRNGASPNLPDDYLAAIDRIKPDPHVGTCASAAATGSVTVTPEFRTDEKWNGLRHLPMALGFVGAWSMPIKSAEGKVMGTLGTYFRRRRVPTPDQVRSIRLLAEAASSVLTKHQTYGA
jgi:GAF domain-containing protein